MDNDNILTEIAKHLGYEVNHTVEAELTNILTKIAKLKSENGAIERWRTAISDFYSEMYENHKKRTEAFAQQLNREKNNMCTHYSKKETVVKTNTLISGRRLIKCMLCGLRYEIKQGECPSCKKT